MSCLLADFEMLDVTQRAAAVREWLEGHLSPAWLSAIREQDEDELRSARRQLDVQAWWRELGRAGLVCPTWPREYGGLGVSAASAQIINEELARYKVPRSENPIGLNLAGPAILQWGTVGQKERFLPPIPRHEEIWCQLFSEPGAGSDLASLSTMARNTDDGWSITGEKVWSSLAHRADWGLLLARTDPLRPKHHGISCFLLDMHLPGVTVEPLYNITGNDPNQRGIYDFNRVFLDDVRLTEDAILGAENEGWRVAVSVLMQERVSISGAGSSLPGAVAGRSVQELVARYGPLADVVMRGRLTRMWIQENLIRATVRRAAARRASGATPGPEGSVGKVAQSEFAQDLQTLALDLMEREGVAWDAEDAWAAGTVWSYLNSRSRTIAGGTSEINRNVLGERSLGLPKDIQVDRDVPWIEVRRSTLPPRVR